MNISGLIFHRLFGKRMFNNIKGLSLDIFMFRNLNSLNRRSRRHELPITRNVCIREGQHNLMTYLLAVDILSILKMHSAL